jgi:hypothetical protein
MMSNQCVPIRRKEINVPLVNTQKTAKAQLTNDNQKSFQNLICGRVNQNVEPTLGVLITPISP